MITNFKIFEKIILNDYMFGRDIFFINGVVEYLKADSDIMDESMPESPYVDNIIDFFKEILMNKTIIFESEDKNKNYPTIKGTVEDVGSFSYKGEFYVKVKLNEPKILIHSEIKKDNYVDYPDNLKEWFLIRNNYVVHIYDYDADTKPLHELVKLKKKTEKYNI